MLAVLRCNLQPLNLGAVGTAIASMLGPGDACEVSGSAADGFQAAWFTGVVKSVHAPAGNARVVPVATILFPDFINSATGEPEHELHPVSSLRLRPRQPDAGASLGEYQVGEPVDVLEKDVWWHAVIIDRCSQQGLRVYYIGSAERCWISNPAAIRPGKVYVAGQWHPRPLPADLPKSLIRPQAAQAQAQAQAQAHAAAAAKAGKGAKKAQAAAAAAEAAASLSPSNSNDENSNETVMVRRSARERASRITMIDGKPVLKLNCYDLEGGERSVFEQELSRPKPARGGTTGPAATWVAVQHPAKRQKAAGGSAAAGAAYLSDDEGGLEDEEEVAVASPSKAARWNAEVLEHNAAIKADKQAMQGRRAAFLEQHLEVMRPFITQEVAANIRAKAAAAQASGLPPLPPPVEVQPGCLEASLREYQLEGLRWMVSMWDNGVNCILADEMGLGKTLQSISLLSYLKFERGVEGPHLVVVPLSVLPSWLSEFQRWSPQMRVVRLHTSDPDERNRLKREVLSHPESFDVAVTTYDMVKSKDWSVPLSRMLRWRYLVLDEGHRIKNEETQLAHAMRKIQRQQTLLLTGTPLQNNLHELYALLSYLYPDVFTTPKPFDDAFDLRTHKVDIAQLEKAHDMLRPFTLRRLKQEVELGMPPLVETRINCPLSLMQTFWYRRLLIKDSTTLLRLEEEVAGKVQYDKNNNSYKKLHMLVAQLRKCVNHPFLFPGAEPEFDGHSTDDSIVEASGKMEVLDRMLRKLKKRGHRVVLFSQFNMQLDILEDYMNMRGYKYSRLDGSTNRVQRMIDIKLFNRPGSDVFVYLLNTRAGGLGVNLQTADTVILYDSDWNPQCDLQAMARVHRIGQTKPVHVYRLCTEGTIEERIQHRAEKKLFLDQMVNRGSVAGVEVESLSRSELLSMLRFGCDRIFQNEEGRAPTDAELDAIIDRSTSRAAAAAAAEQAATASAGAPPSTGKRKGKRGKGKSGAASGSQAAGSSPTSPIPQAAAATAGAGPVLSSPAKPLPLVEAKQVADRFDAQTQPLSTYIFGGKDYSQLDSLKAIGKEFWRQHGRGKREKRERLVQVGEHAVLRENMYDMRQGEPSVFDREAVGFKGRAGQKKPGKSRLAMEHQDFCQICWDGGDLVCCDYCPAAYHADCLALSEAELAASWRWACPHHTCAVCARKTGAVGGMLFRCEGCSHAYCEDHLPSAADVVMTSARFDALGMPRTATACYVRCTTRCSALVEALEGAGAAAAARAARPHSR